MALLASGISIPQISDLGSAFQNYGNQGLAGINGIYGNAKTQATAQGLATGQPGQGSYSQQRLGAQQGLDTSGLEAALGGTLGNTVYQNSLGQRGYNQQSQLATEIGNLNRPSNLQQIFQGIGVGGKVGGGLYGMYSHPSPTPLTYDGDPTAWQ